MCYAVEIIYVNQFVKKQLDGASDLVGSMQLYLVK